MAALYYRELGVLLDQLIPLREITHRLRPSDPWFDAECCTVKRQTCQRECTYASSCRHLNRMLHNSTSSQSTDAATARVTAAKTDRYEQLRAYRQLRQRKCTAFWVNKVESECSHLSKLRESVNKLLGCGRTSACSSLSTETLNSFFDEKVCKVRATTSTDQPSLASRSKRIIFKVAMPTFRALHRTVPPYMTSQFICVADMPNRRRLRSASSNQLDVPSFCLPTVGSRVFPIAGAKVWNSLPDNVTSAPSL